MLLFPFFATPERCVTKGIRTTIFSSHSQEKSCYVCQQNVLQVVWNNKVVCLCLAQFKEFCLVSKFLTVPVFIFSHLRSCVDIDNTHIKKKQYNRLLYLEIELGPAT